MRILLLTQVLPFPPDAGPKIKTFNLLRHLAARHQVSLVSFVRSAEEEALAQALAPYCRRVVTVRLARSRLADLGSLARSLVSGEPFVVARDRSPAMEAALRRLVADERFDLVHADQLNMAPYALGLAGPRRVLDEHNAVWLVVQRLWAHEPPGPRRLLLGREWRQLYRYEGRAAAAFDAVLAVSEEDRSALERVLARPVPVHVVPIGVDTWELRPLAREPGASALLAIGTLFWPPNVDGILWFARQVLPLILRERPDVRLLVVGARPASSLLRLSREEPAVQVTGYVADPAPLIRQSALMVVPLRAGGGMRVKILHALAQGLPVVSTTVGCEGIEVTPGRHLLVADRPQDFARAVLRLLADPALARDLAAEGRRLVERRYDWRVVCPEVERVYETLVRGTQYARRNT